MHARVTSFEAATEKIRDQEHQENVIPAAQKMAGFKGGYWVVDRKTGRGFGITLFESESTLKGSEEAAAQLRATAPQLGVKITGVDRYEVVAQVTPEPALATR